MLHKNHKFFNTLSFSEIYLIILIYKICVYKTFKYVLGEISRVCVYGSFERLVCIIYTCLKHIKIYNIPCCNKYIHMYYLTYLWPYAGIFNI